MKITYYILVGHLPVPTTNILAWGKWFETGERRVKQTGIGQTWISTVFLGIDHQLGREGPQYCSRL